jgi:hypothetical protein
VLRGNWQARVKGRSHSLAALKHPAASMNSPVAGARSCGRR